ncbi:hypothetical protein SPBR_09090 [Sporothrix brasiliensis 5110]|uniref:Uncharacterized protein n=1 Tax=Sporothrix brasiliensis 5110 TaxID=1398154 RepID=A0A0C2IRY2_9PEZI|nr:uncharacterized protein SPBR_09090 [Sporothrix brasiliensis 5110]KIH91786.1 hypothetical protein SPBR_09090 [Sporothrix brasiliensis 5110]
MASNTLAEEATSSDTTEPGESPVNGSIQSDSSSPPSGTLPMSRTLSTPSNPSRPVHSTDTHPRQSRTQPPKYATGTQTQTQAKTQIPSQRQSQTQAQTQIPSQRQPQTQTRARVRTRPSRPYSKSPPDTTGRPSHATSVSVPLPLPLAKPAPASTTRTRRIRAAALPKVSTPTTSLTPVKTRPQQEATQEPLLDLEPLPSLGPILLPPPLPPGTAPPRAKLAVQLKVNLEIEVVLKARVCGDLLLSVL